MKSLVGALIFCILTIAAIDRHPVMFGLEFRATIISIKSDTLEIKTILTNTSEDTVKYVTELCPSHSVFEVDNSSVQIIREDVCTKSGAKIVTLLPHQSEIDSIYAKVLPSFDTLKPEFKIGFNFVISIPGDRPAKMREINNRINNTRNIFWSDPLFIRK